MSFHSKSQAQISNTLELHSSSTLGTGTASTHRRRLEKLEHRHTRLSIDNEYIIDRQSESENSEAEGNSDVGSGSDLTVDKYEPGIDNDVETLTPEPFAVVDNGGATARTHTVGSALRSGADGSKESPRTLAKKRGQSVCCYKV